MFFTRFQINPARREARRLLGSPQRLHAAVAAAFPDPSATPDGRVLWRLDAFDRALVHLYIVSPARPDLSHLVEQAGWPTTSGWDSADYDGFLSRLAGGQAWRFRLTANPVDRAPRSETETRGTVRAHVGAHHQGTWLMSRAAGWGFDLPDAVDDPGRLVRARATDQFERASDEAAHTVTLSRVTFQGVLLVRDADDLRRALTHGMGRAKAYGCGLMTLAPLPAPG